jgi:hypothetical protein
MTDTITSHNIDLSSWDALYIGYLIIYRIFARLLSKLREIQYKISTGNAVEYFWVCV